MSPNHESSISDFEQARPMLIGMAYRILGSRADAEDAVQDTFLKWQSERETIDNPASWLTTACTRRCIDMLRSAHKSRVEYVGTWLPEPLETAVGGGTDAPGNAEDALSLASSLTTAFLLVLERLTPKERAAYLLHEIFEVPYPDISRSLELPETACRKLVSRARTNVEQSNVRHVTPVDRQEQLLAAFEAAVVGGDTAKLTVLLSDDIELRVDSGGKVPSIREDLHGKANVLTFLEQGLHRWWGAYEWIPVELNGTRSFVLRSDGAVVASVSFGFDPSGVATSIFIMRNPDKLAALSDAVPPKA